MDYLLFKTKANLLRRDLSSVIETQRSLEIQSSNRKRGLKRALNAELEILESLDFKMFWNDILIPNLKSRHQVTPTHSLEEIIKLHAYFPKNIRQFNVLISRLWLQVLLFLNQSMWLTFSTYQAMMRNKNLVVLT